MAVVRKHFKFRRLSQLTQFVQLSALQLKLVGWNLKLFRSSVSHRRFGCARHDSLICRVTLNSSMAAADTLLVDMKHRCVFLTPAAVYSFMIIRTRLQAVAPASLPPVTLVPSAAILVLVQALKLSRTLRLALD